MARIMEEYKFRRGRVFVGCVLGGIIGCNWGFLGAFIGFVAGALIGAYLAMR